MKRIYSLIVILALLLCVSAQAYATLTTIGQAEYGSFNYNLIWDNDTPFGSIVWLDTTSFSSDWQTAMAWANSLNGAGVLTYTINQGYSVAWNGDWRLPLTVDSSASSGYNITSSEMGHLYYTELGNLGYLDTNGNVQSGYGLNNVGPFSFYGLRPTAYWSGTENAAVSSEAWWFYFAVGNQGSSNKTLSLPVGIAVRPADVTFSAVPESATMLLLGSGLVGLLAGRRMFKR